MVGGRSNGCRTCKRRRVKCDETHPLCNRCEKAGFTCEGYGRDIRFVNETKKVHRRQEAKAAASSTTSQSPQSENEESSWQTSWLPESPDSQGSLAIVRPKAQTDSTLPVRIDLAGFQDNIHSSFLLTQIFAGTKKTLRQLLAGYEDNESATSYHALRALAKVYFGRKHHQEDCIDAASLHYGKALRLLNRDIHSDNARSLGVLSSVMNLSMYEMIVSRSDHGVLQHAGGLGRLIELRGPYAHQSPAELKFLDTSRMAIVHKYIRERRHCFLEQEDWKTIPWELSPEPKSVITRLIDIIVDLPGLAEDCNTARSYGNPVDRTTAIFQSTYRGVLSHLRDLYEWRAEWELAFPAVSMEVESPISTFDTILSYSTLEDANAIGLYNTAFLCLYQIGIGIVGAKFDASLPAFGLSWKTTNPALIPAGQANGVDAAIELCRSVEYHLLPHHASAGAFMLLFPMNLALASLPSDSEEADYCRDTFRRISVSAGLNFSNGYIK